MYGLTAKRSSVWPRKTDFPPSSCPAPLSPFIYNAGVGSGKAKVSWTEKKVKDLSLPLVQQSFIIKDKEPEKEAAVLEVGCLATLSIYNASDEIAAGH